jgi:hypothetical protein
MVFDTTDESFRQMHPPVVPGRADLFETDGMLRMSSYNDAETIIDIWVLEDYGSELWTLECRIELPVAEIRARCGWGKYEKRWGVVAVPGDGEVLVRYDIASGCFMLTWIASWLTVSTENALVLLNFNSNKLLFSMLSFQR